MTLRVKKITFYNNGYTTFVKEAEFEGDQAIDVYFRKSDYNEVMKSLSIIAEGEGKIASVSFQSEKQVEQLEDLTIRINNDYSLTSVLKSIPGSRLAVETLEGRIVGNLIGIEKIVTDQREDHVINLFTENKIQSFALSTLRSIELLEKNLQQEFSHVLEVYNSQKKKDLLKLTIFAKGKSYIVRMIYSVMTPVWETCYRLFLSEKSPSECRLGVFAIIQNTQEEDWKDVTIEFVTGAPNIAPSASDGGAAVGGGNMTVIVRRGQSTYRVQCSSSDLVETFKAKVGRQSGHPAGAIKLVFCGKPIQDGRTLREYNIRSGSSVSCVIRDTQARAVETSGPTFRLCHPTTLTSLPINGVSVKRNQSAFIEILATQVEIQLVTMYNQSFRKGNPLCALIYENLTGYSLLQGSFLIKSPVDGATIGECEMEPMWPKDQILKPFAIEFGVEVKVNDNFSKLKIHRATIKDGKITLFRYAKLRTMYNLQNRTDRTFPKFYVDHFFKEGWKLVDSDEPLDITDKFFRFETNLKKQEVKVFNVREQSVDQSTIYLSNISQETIEKYLKLGVFTEEIAKEISKILDFRSDINSREKAIYRIDENMRQSKDKQSRARQNLNVLKDPTLRKKYGTILSQEEDRLATYEKERNAVRAEKQVLQLQKEKYTNSIVYEYACEEVKKKE